MIISMGIMSWNLNIVTIWFYLLMGVVQGWTGSSLLPLVQRYVAPEEQTTVVSLTHVISRLVYIPASLALGWATDISLKSAPLVNLAIFTVLGIYVLSLLRPKE